MLVPQHEHLMQSPNNRDQSEQNVFTPKQSFDEYRLKHGPNSRYYKSISDPVSDKVSNRRRAQIILALIAITIAIAITYLITGKL